jgi:polyhydroxyalkanoate synthesis regulator phasin
MNSNNLLQLLQTGFRVSLGATTSLVETLQDPQKREENLAQLRTELSQRVIEWAEKGEITELEARRFIDELFRQQSRSTSSSPTGTSSDTVTTSPTSSTTAASPNVQLELEELTAQISAIRTELEKLRDSEANN